MMWTVFARNDGDGVKYLPSMKYLRLLNKKNYEMWNNDSVTNVFGRNIQRMSNTGSLYHLWCLDP